jgi:DNA-binding response OmpR family regulator
MSQESDLLRNVLVVDDDPSVRRAIVRMLSARGYAVREAENGAQALKVLALPDAPRLAIVDFNMKTMTGPELCRILRARKPYVYVVLMTADSGERVLNDAMNSGADVYIQKPFNPDELAARLLAGRESLRATDMNSRSS